MQDALMKGRLKIPQNIGETNPNAKLNWVKVARMRQMRKRKIPLKDIAKAFGVSVPSTSEICAGKAWVTT
jgi:hypothetical protein